MNRWLKLALMIGGLVIIIAVPVALLVHSAPAEGSSCVNASESEVDAWVGSKEGEIPSSVSKESVENEVQGICRAANTANESQDFSEELLHEAIEASGG